jgi:hypothetical protein
MLTKENLLTHDRLTKLLTYDPETGHFIWQISKPGISYDKQAGSLKPEGYIVITIDYSLYLAHRLAYFYMTKEWPAEEIDHINRNRADNRWCNLRPASHSENALNCSLRKDNMSGKAGVTPSSQSSWKVHHKGKYLGTFALLEDAIKAKEEAEQC